MRRSRHYGHAAKTNDLALKGGRTLRQARLPLRGRGGRLRLSRGRKPRLLLHHIGKWIGPAPLLDQSLPAGIKNSCTTSKEQRINRWEHEHVLEAVQRRLDEHPEKMRQRRETVEHPFGTIKARMGATHFLMKTLPRVAAEMALHVLAYNMTRVMNIMGTKPLIAAMEGVVPRRARRPSAVAEPPGRLKSGSEALPDRKINQTPKMTTRRHVADVTRRRCYRQRVFARPRPGSDFRTQCYVPAEIA